MCVYVCPWVSVSVSLNVWKGGSWCLMVLLAVWLIYWANNGLKLKMGLWCAGNVVNIWNEMVSFDLFIEPLLLLLSFVRWCFKGFSAFTEHVKILIWSVFFRHTEDMITITLSRHAGFDHKMTVMSCRYLYWSSDGRSRKETSYGFISLWVCKCLLYAGSSWILNWFN